MRYGSLTCSQLRLQPLGTQQITGHADSCFLLSHVDCLTDLDHHGPRGPIVLLVLVDMSSVVLSWAVPGCLPLSAFPPQAESGCVPQPVLQAPSKLVTCPCSVLSKELFQRVFSVPPLCAVGNIMVTPSVPTQLMGQAAPVSLEVTTMCPGHLNSHLFCPPGLGAWGARACPMVSAPSLPSSSLGSELRCLEITAD